MHIEFLVKKKKQEILDLIKEKYGFDLPSCQIIKQSTNKLRIFTGNLSEHELSILTGTVRVETAGLYFATIDKIKEGSNEEVIRFSFDSSFLGKEAIKNVLELEDEQVKQWFRGEDIELEGEVLADYPYLLLKYKNEMVGCGKLAQGKVLNFVPKERRIKY